MKEVIIRVITFDLDDTLWHTAPVIQKAEQAMYDWVIQQAPKAEALMNSRQFDPIKQAMYNQHPELAHQISEVRIIALQKALRQAGYNSKQSKNWALEAFDIFINARHEVELFDDTAMMLEQLHQRYQLGVLTNGNADISRLDINEFFDFSFAAEALNSSKPAPAHFLAAMEACQVEAHQIIHVGDHPHHDIKGALDAGCHALWFNPNNQTWPETSPEPPQVQQITDIPGAIKQIALLANTH